MIHRKIGDYLPLTRRAMSRRNVEVRAFTPHDYLPILEVARSALPGSVVLLFESTLSFHLQCTEKGIDDGRRFWVYLHGGRHISIAGYQHRVADPSEICWAGWFLVEKSAPPKLKISIIGDMLERCLRQPAFKTLFIEAYSGESASNIYAIYRKFNLREVCRIENFYGRGEGLCIMSLDLEKIRAEVRQSEIPGHPH